MSIIRTFNARNQIELSREDCESLGIHDVTLTFQQEDNGNRLWIRAYKTSSPNTVVGGAMVRQILRGY